MTNATATYERTCCFCDATITNASTAGGECAQCHFPYANVQWYQGVEQNKSPRWNT